MSEWWTYTLSDFLLFSPRTYYRLFELYNAAVWPAQIVAVALAALLFWLAWRGGGATRAGLAVLAGCWLFAGWAFVYERYATINWAAEYVAFGFAAQALLLAGRAAAKLPATLPSAPARFGGGALILVGLSYPLLAPLSGRPLAQAETFGLAPDPTALVTIGFVVAAMRSGLWLLAIPVAWCMLSGATLWAMAIWHAPLLPASALAALALTMAKGRMRS